MEFLRLVLLFVHLVGFASLFGGLFTQVRADPRVVNNAMFHGVLTMLVTGLLQVGVLEGLDAGPNNAKIGVKLLVTVVLTVLIVLNRKKPRVPTGLYFGLAGLTLLNAAIAVFWASAHG